MYVKCLKLGEEDCWCICLQNLFIGMLRLVGFLSYKSCEVKQFEETLENTLKQKGVNIEESCVSCFGSYFT